MKTKLSMIIVLTLILVNLSAFDGKRKGFLLGYGIGVSNVSYHQEIESDGNTEKSDDENDTGFATDFKIGYAPNNKLEIFYSGKTAWFSMMNVNEDEVTISNAIGVIGASYFLSSRLSESEWYPSLYLSGGLGISSWDVPFEEEKGDPWVGFGVFGGVGYEFVRHLRIEADLCISNPSIEEEGITFTTYSTAIMVTVSAMAF